MKPQKNEDRITKIMNDPQEVGKIIQSAIDEAMLKHKQAGNPVCGSKNGEIYWVDAANIPTNKK